VSKEWLLAGSVDPESYVAYGQMAYWLVLWITASLVCVTTTQAMLLLYGLACGALLTASSILFGLAFGGLNFYEDDLVSSSAGWFNTAKTITGILVCGAAVILYLGSGRRRPWLYGILAAFCLVGAVLTYARAGTVALAAVIVWLALWAARAGGFFQWQALKWFLSLMLIIALAAPVVIHPQTLFARWGDVTEGEEAGSGRVGLWNIAVEGFAAAPLSTQLLGRGFESMAELLYRECGEDVKHTHNDAFDMLLVGGVAGIVWLLSFIWTWGARIARFSPWSLEGAVAVAVFIDYLCHAQFTGQLWGTDVMNYYVIALTALTVIGCLQRVSPGVRQTACLPPSMTATHPLLEEELHA
jgi:O-antigen ligase